MQMKAKQSGTFTISPGREVYGELTLAGAKTSLYLHDKEFFNARDIGHLNGVLHDLTKVSLIHCITPGTGSGSRQQESYHFAYIFPHFVAYGDRHIAPDEKAIAEVHFVIDDATTLFYDFDAFGSVIDARSYIDQIAHANRLSREIPTGPNPQILYFTGKHEIFTADTVFGRISASHRPTYGLGGPEGVGIKNTIFVTIAVDEYLTFKDAIARPLTLTRYLGLLVGRPQGIRHLSLRLGADRNGPVILRVYWSMPPKRDLSREAEKPHPADVLLDGAREPERFSAVLRSWLARHEEWHDARLRFFNSFAEQRLYAIDRLIGAANMFDILPGSAVPPDVELTDELKSAQSDGLDLFRSLPESPERNSVLSALGRIGKASL